MKIGFIILNIYASRKLTRTTNNNAIGERKQKGKLYSTTPFNVKVFADKPPCYGYKLRKYYLIQRCVII